MNPRLRRMGRHIPPVAVRLPVTMLAPVYLPGCERGLHTCDRCVPSCDLYVEPPPTDNEWLRMQSIDQRRRGGRHRRQR